MCRTRSTVVEEEEVNYKNIPADVRKEILSYLPGKKLQTLKIVCKDWLQLITSSVFTRLHLSKSIPSHFRVLVNGVSFPIMEYNNYDKWTLQNIAYPPQFSYRTIIFGSANGLAFLFDNHEIGVLNPSTRKSCVVKLCPPLPTDNRDRNFYPCLADLGGGEYILVMGMYDDSGTRFETWVYKFTHTSTMNRICSTQNTLQRYYHSIEKKGIFVRGVVHWPVRILEGSYLYYKILSYHLGENKHMEISPPAQCDFMLGLFVDGCSLLATFVNTETVAVLWIMKEEDCWTKYATIGPGNKFPSIDPLGFFPNGDLIMDVDKRRLVKYSFNYDEATLLTDYTYRGKWRMDGVIMCADTLLSPDCMFN